MTTFSLTMPLLTPMVISLSLQWKMPKDVLKLKLPKPFLTKPTEQKHSPL